MIQYYQIEQIITNGKFTEYIFNFQNKLLKENARSANNSLKLSNNFTL